MARVSAALIFLTLCCWHTSAQTSAFRFQSQIGLVTLNSSGDVCLTVPTSNLAEGDRVQIVIPDKPQRVITATLQTRLSISCTESSDFSQPVSSYSLTRLSGKFETGTVGFAVVGVNTRFRVSGGLASADINNDGRREYFRSCASREGLHLTIWSGRPLRGVRRWHHYYYLGYDLEPNCTNREVR